VVHFPGSGEGRVGLDDDVVGGAEGGEGGVGVEGVELDLVYGGEEAGGGGEEFFYLLLIC
jgi:hypothetical protein